VKFSSREFELKKIIVIAIALASLVLTAGLAVAAQFVGNGGSIQGCVKNGLLEVVKAGKRCPRHSTPLPFNQVGPRGRQGVPGVQGVQGIPGPVTTTAPSGVTQRGLFYIAGDTTYRELGTSITFALELSASPTVVEVPNGVPNPDPAHCPGSPEAPSAAPGYLCLYDKLEEDVSQVFADEYLQVSDVDNRMGEASPFGAKLVAAPQRAGHVDIVGSWAVTAP
jgi:hypothetical protein